MDQFHPDKQHLYVGTVILLLSCPSLRSHSRKRSTLQRCAVLKEDSKTGENNSPCVYVINHRSPDTTPIRFNTLQYTLQLCLVLFLVCLCSIKKILYVMMKIISLSLGENIITHNNFTSITEPALKMSA